MPNLIATSKSFLEWAQSIPDVVIPAGLESDMQEAIEEAEAAEHHVQRTGKMPCKNCRTLPILECECGDYVPDFSRR